MQASDGSQACSARSPGAAPPLTMLARRGIHSGRRPVLDRGRAGRSSIRRPRRFCQCDYYCFFSLEPSGKPAGPNGHTRRTASFHPRSGTRPLRGRMAGERARVSGSPNRAFAFSCCSSSIVKFQEELTSRGQAYFTFVPSYHRATACVVLAGGWPRICWTVFQNEPKQRQLAIRVPRGRTTVGASCCACRGSGQQQQRLGRAAAEV